MSKMKDLYYLYQTDETARQFYDLGVCDALHSMLIFFEEKNLDVPYGIRDAILNLIENNEVSGGK